MMECCACGAKTSQLLQDGFFLSGKIKHSEIRSEANSVTAPIKPLIAFLMELLLFFNNILMHGSLSKFAFAIGLSHTIMLIGQVRLPDLKKPWESAYFNWLEVSTLSESLLRYHLLNCCGFDLDNTAFSNLCPACFFNYAKNPDHTSNVSILTIDGNFQHCKYKRISMKGEKTCITAMFIKSEGEDEKISDPPASGCGHSFAAADTSEKLKSMKNLDETGLMGVTCHHG